MQSRLQRMVKAVDLPQFGFSVARAGAPAVAAANVLPGIVDTMAQPAVDPSTGVWALLDGELLDLSEARAVARAQGFDIEGLADLDVVISLYKVIGLDVVEVLNGTFNLLVYDPRDGRAHLVTDRFGSRMIFVAEDLGGFVFSSELKGVIAGRKGRTRAGGVGLLELFSGGTSHDESTWAEGIRVLAPGTIVSFGTDGVVERRYHRMRFNDGAAGMSEREAIDLFAHRLEVATERCFRNSETVPVGITLSGGLDSRSIALSLDRKRLPIAALTYGDPESADVRYARQLAELIGLDHHYVEDARPSLIEDAQRTLNRVRGTSTRGLYGVQLDRVLWRSEAMGPFPGMSSMIWHPLYQRIMRAYLNGACGDALTGSHLSPRLLAVRTRSQLQSYLWSNWFWQDPALVQSVLAPTFVRQHRAEMHERFQRYLDGINIDHPMAVQSVWDMENRQRRGTFSTFTIERYFCQCRAPYLDYELAAFLSSMPLKWRFGQRLYKRMLVTQHPRAAHVPWAYTEGRITGSPVYEFAREAFRFAQRSVTAMLPRKGDAPAHYAFRDELALIRAEPELGRTIRRWVGSEAFDASVFSREGILRFLDTFESGSGGLAESKILAHLVGMARCHEWFLGDAIAPVPEEADPYTFGVRPVHLDSSAYAG